MATTGPGPEEIIEKRTTDPVAMACLVIACLALLGASVFPIVEIAKYRSGGTPAVVKKGPGQDRAEKFLRTLKEDVDNLIRASSAGPVGEKELGSEGTEAETIEKASPETEPAPEAESAPEAEPAAEAPADEQPSEAEEEGT